MARPDTNTLPLPFNHDSSELFDEFADLCKEFDRQLNAIRNSRRSHYLPRMDDDALRLWRVTFVLGRATPSGRIALPLTVLAEIAEITPDLAAQYVIDYGACGVIDWAWHYSDDFGCIRDYRGKSPDEVAAYAHEVFGPRSAAGSARLAACPGWVYVLEAEGGHFKIGRTIDLPRRMETLLSIQIPQRVEFVCAIPADDYVSLEAQYHECYANKRGKGEWFALDADDVATLKAAATVFELPTRGD